MRGRLSRRRWASRGRRSTRSSRDGLVREAVPEREERALGVVRHVRQLPPDGLDRRRQLERQPAGRRRAAEDRSSTPRRSRRSWRQRAAAAAAISGITAGRSRKTSTMVGTCARAPGSRPLRPLNSGRRHGRSARGSPRAARTARRSAQDRRGRRRPARRRPRRSRAATSPVDVLDVQPRAAAQRQHARSFASSTIERRCASAPARAEAAGRRSARPPPASTYGSSNSPSRNLSRSSRRTDSSIRASAIRPRGQLDEQLRAGLAAELVAAGIDHLASRSGGLEVLDAPGLRAFRPSRRTSCR